MPMYSYICTKCYYLAKIIKPMTESDKVEVCTLCGYQMRRDFRADLFNTPHGSYGVPIVSDSLAVSIDQIEEHKQMFPDIEVTKEGQPVFRNFKQHEAYLKKTGFVKSPKKKKRAAKKVSI